MTQRYAGWTFLVFAGLLALSNIADAFEDLQSWHGAASVLTPSLFAPVIKQVAVAGLAALGGKMLPPFGEKE